MEKTIAKMLRRDVLVVVGFGVFLWVTMAFLAYAILIAVGPSDTRTVLIAIGAATLLFATLSLVALILHLRKQRHEIYTEELRHAHPEPETASEDDAPVELSQEQAPGAPHTSNAFVKVFDIVFIMLLCFGTLLATMLLRGKTVNNAHIYDVKLPIVILTVVGFTLYFLYLLRHSHKELKLMVEEMYREDEAPSAIADKGAAE